MSDTDSGTETGVALEALRQLKSGLEATKLELEDCKLKVSCLGELNFCSACRTVPALWYSDTM